jgi:hypothetical protein
MGDSRLEPLVLSDAERRTWAFGLQPWRVEDFMISPDPLPTGKIRDVIGLYLAPPANAAVFAVDESRRSRPCSGPRRYCR